jgi:hypothetical protein
MMFNSCDHLTDDEMDNVVLALARGAKRFHDGGTFSDADLNKVADWIDNIVIGSGLVECAARGLIDISIGDDGDLLFNAASPTPTPPAAQRP